MLGYYRLRSLAKQGDNALGSACPYARPSVRPLMAEPFDLRPRWRLTLTLARLGL